MLTRLRANLTYANVMSTVGVFLALGGGFALGKLKGDGRVVQTAVSQVSGDLETIAKVNGVVKVLAQCTGSLQATVRNTSTKTLQLYHGVGVGTTIAALTPGDEDQFALSGNEIVQVFRAGGDGTPMASLTITGQYPGSCAAEPPVAVTAIGSE